MTNPPIPEPTVLTHPSFFGNTIPSSLEFLDYFMDQNQNILNFSQQVGISAKQSLVKNEKLMTR